MRKSRESSHFSWVVLNQSQSPWFQDMIETLADDLGPCLLYTGMPWPKRSDNVYVERGPAYDRRGIGLRSLSWLRFAITAFGRTLVLPGRPFVLVVTNPPLLPHVVWLLSKCRGFRYGILVWDVFPDSLITAGMTTEHSSIVRGWTAANRLALGAAEFVVAIGEGLAKPLHAQLSPKEVHIKIIPNISDTAAIKPVKKTLNEFARRWDQLGKITVLYSGNIGATHGLDSLIGAADLLRENQSVSFMIIGNGASLASVQNGVQRHALHNVLFMKPLEWQEFPLAVATGDIAIIVQAPGCEHLSIPSKAYTSLAAGSALIALTQPESDLARLVRDCGVGLVLDNGDASGLAAAIESLASNRPRLEALKVQARNVAETRFSPEVVHRAWLEVLAPRVGKLRGDPHQRTLR